MATAKQLDFIQRIIDVLDNEFDFGDIGQKRYYSIQEANELITLNKDSYYDIVDSGQCTVSQYNLLTKIAGRTPKYERHHIGFAQAVEWINRYTQRKEAI